jgi:hypothetical protein
MAMLLIGAGRELIRGDETDWRRRTPASGLSSALAFMTPDHHAVRNLAVDRMAATGRPLSSRAIASSLGLSLPRVRQALADLDAALFFLVRDGPDEVRWAFPVTSERTDHRVRLSTGETVFAACAEDAVATPLVLTRLRGRAITATVGSRCRHCQRPLVLDVNSDAACRCSVASVLLFEPTIDWSQFRGESIVDDY